MASDDDKFTVEINLSAKITLSPSLSKTIVGENLSATISAAIEKLTATLLSDHLIKKPPLSDQITLKSSDGREFAISKSAAALSGTISAAIEKLKSTSSQQQQQGLTIPIPGVNGETLEVVVTYLNARAAAGNDEEATNKLHCEFLPARETKTIILFNVLSAAQELQVRDLEEEIFQKIESIKKSLIR